MSLTLLRYDVGRLVADRRHCYGRHQSVVIVIASHQRDVIIATPHCQIYVTLGQAASEDYGRSLNWLRRRYQRLRY